jgi:DegV family protein with EDD domain
VPQVSLLFFVDTLEYLQKGGRIGKAQAFVGTLLNVKPLLTLRDGEVFPVDRVRTRGKAVERLCEYVADFPHIEEIGVLDSTGTPETETLIERLSAYFPKEKILRAKYGPVLGVHLGPKTLGVAVYEGLPQGYRVG